MKLRLWIIFSLLLSASTAALAAVNLDFSASRQDCYSTFCDGGYDPQSQTGFGYVSFNADDFSYYGNAFFELTNPTSVIQTQYGWAATFGPGSGGGISIDLTFVNGGSYSFTGRTISGTADVEQQDQGDRSADASINFIGTWSNGYHAIGGASFGFQEIDYFYSSGAGAGAMTTATPEPGTLVLWLGLLPSAGMAAKRHLR
jgi:hypothetical protein